jgi:predicted phosphoribosyltransferase
LFEYERILTVFQSRVDAGRKLAKALVGWKGQRPVILALPRGGVPVAAEVARALDGELDLLLVRKIGTPGQEEVAMGAIAEGDPSLAIRNEAVIQSAGISRSAFERACSAERTELERRRRRYLRDRPRTPLGGRVVIIVDDGIATGATMLAAIRSVRAAKPSELVLAVPVAPPGTLETLRPEVDAIVCLDTPRDFGAVGMFYEDFGQVTDEEVIAILDRVHSAPMLQVEQP